MFKHARGPKAELLVHMLGDLVVWGIVDQQEVILAGFLGQVDDFPDGSGAVALVLVFHREHDAPDDQALFFDILIQHHESDGFVIVVDSEGKDVARVPVEPGLGQGIGVAGDEVFVVGALHADDGVEVVLGDGAEVDHGGSFPKASP